MTVPIIDKELFSLLLTHARVLDSSEQGRDSAASASVLDHIRDLSIASAAVFPTLPEHFAAFATVDTFTKRFSGLTGRLGIKDYLARIVATGGAPASSCVDIATMLMIRLRGAILGAIEAIIGSEELDRQLAGATFVIPTPLVFRAALTALVIGIKLQSDIFHPMSHYSFAGGVQKAHLILLERDFLALIEYNIAIPASEYRQFQEDLWASQHEKMLSLCSPFLQPLPTTPTTSPSDRRQKMTVAELNDDDHLFEDTFLSEDASSVHTPTSINLV